MYPTRITIFLLLLSLWAGVAVAQTKGAGDPGTTSGSVYGKLADAQGKPVSYATVTLLRNDSTIVGGDLSADDGSFTIKPSGFGSFLLRVSSIGFVTRVVPVQVKAEDPDKYAGTIKLGQTENKLKEVNVVGEKPIMELKVDKKVFNVEKNTTTAGGSATDVLQNVPSVSVDADGNVSLRGKDNVTILIDGKPATMLGSDVASALQSLPAGSIESVEVITNPSAKYDAQGTTGILNIITKKDGRLGINGTATLGAGTRDKYNGNFGINVRKGKWNVFENTSFRLNSTYHNVITDRNDKIPTAGNLQSYYTYEHVPRDFNGTFNSIGATYDADKYNSITVTENINLMQFRFKDNSDYYIYKSKTDLYPDLFFQHRDSKFEGQPFSLSTAVDYKHKFKKKDEELSVDATYASTTMRRWQDYKTVTLPDRNLYSPIIESAPGHGSNSTLTLWSDYTDPLFTPNGKLGLGFKSTFYSFKSSNDPIVDTANRPRAIDSSILSIYDYTQQTHAAYANWSDQLGKFSYQAGVRVEDALYDGNGQVPRYATFHNSFLNLFPSAFVSYQLGNQQSIYLNYSRRTNRPGFMQLLPFTDLSNPSTVNKGNPGLIPEFINNIEFSYSKSDNKGNNFIYSAYYAYTQNLIERLTRPITQTEVDRYGGNISNLFSQPVNIASGATYGLEGTGHLQLLPIWDATLNLNFFQNQLIIGNIDTAYSKYLKDNSGFTWFGKLNTNLKLPKNFSFQANVNYESPKVVAQGNLKETYWVDLALRKNFWKNKATLVINCADVFKTHVYVTNYDLASFYETINRVKESRIGTINFTYRFGKTDAGKNGPGAKRPKGIDKPTDQDRAKNLKEGDDGDQGGGGGAPGAPGGQRKDNGPRN